MAGMLRHTHINARACAAAAADPMLLATDLADELVRKGVAFREAHHIVGRVVAAAEAAGKPLNALSPAALRAVDPRLGAGTRRNFHLETAMKRRRATGSPGTVAVQTELAAWRKRLAPR
jgi:argininosuccinate lyase